MHAASRCPAARSGVKLTYDDFVHFPDDGKRHELIDGEHNVTPSPNIRHQAILGNLHFAVRSWLETHPVGRVFFAPLDIVFTQFDVVEPDLLYMSHERAGQILTEKHVCGVPELVVEWLHRAHAGETRRSSALYERTGVSEYWIVDPKDASVRVYRREGVTFAAPVDLTRDAGDVLTTAILLGLTLPLTRVFKA